MLVKIVVVEVVDVAAYDRAQRAWSKLGTTLGFIGQTGGWTQNQHAVIVAFWESASAHDAFMKNGHDAFEREFLGSHRAIDVLLANALVPLRGTSDLISGGVGCDVSARHGLPGCAATRRSLHHGPARDLDAGDGIEAGDARRCVHRCRRRPAALRGRDALER